MAGCKLLALGCALVLLALSSPALGYCRKTTCSTLVDPPEECLNEDAWTGHTEETGCDERGIPLFWAKTCISFSAQYEGSPKWDILGSEFELIIREAFNNWQWAQCADGRSPNLRVDTYPKVACKEQRYNTNARNQNVWFFQDDRWPYEDHRLDDIAVTTLVFNRITGEIYDADVEFNSANYPFVLDDSATGTDRIDLRSIAQHESGHVLGFEDLPRANAVDSMTMFPRYSGGIGWRDLDADAIAAVCDSYPPTDNPDLSCIADPRHGFTTECAPDDGCTIALVRPGFARQRWVGLCWLGALGLLRAHRPRTRGHVPGSVSARS